MAEMTSRGRARPRNRLARQGKGLIFAASTRVIDNRLHRDCKATKCPVEVYRRGSLSGRTLALSGKGAGVVHYCQGIEIMRKIVLAAVAALAVSACSQEAADPAATASEAVEAATDAATDAAAVATDAAATVTEAAAKAEDTAKEAGAAAEGAAADAAAVAEEAAKKM